MALYQVPTQNSLQLTLSSGYTAGDTTMTLSQTLTGIVQAPGVLVVDRVDSNGNATPTKREYLTFTGVSSTQVTGVSGGKGGSSSANHSIGAVVEFIPDVVWAQAIYDAITAEHSTSGAHSTTYVVTPTGTQAVTNKDMTSGTNTFAIPESGLSLSDNTTADVSTSKHGFVPKAPNDTTKFLRGDGTWATSSSSTPNNYVYSTTSGYNTTSTTFTNIDGTNMNQSLTTTNSHKVRVMLSISDITNSSTSNPINVIEIVRDSTLIGQATLQSTNPAVATPVNISVIDSPTTGAHTYTVKWKTSAGTLTALSQSGIIVFSVEEINAG